VQQLIRRLERWLVSDYSRIDASHPSRVIRLSRALRLPGQRNPAIASLTYIPEGAGSLVLLDLWRLIPGSVTQSVLAATALDLTVVEAYYQDLVERAQLGGLGPLHHFQARGNVVGREVSRTPALAYLAEAGRNLRIWTYKSTSRGFSLNPHCGGTSPQLRFALLEKALSWSSSRSTVFSAGQERRHSKRRALALQVVLHFYGGGNKSAETALGTLSDVSLSGACIEIRQWTQGLRPVPKLVSIAMPNERGAIHLPAEIVRFQSGRDSSVGVRFGTLTRQTRERLRRIVSV